MKNSKPYPHIFGQLMAHKKSILFLHPCLFNMTYIVSVVLYVDLCICISPAQELFSSSNNPHTMTIKKIEQKNEAAAATERK